MKKTLGVIFGAAMIALGSGQAIADEATDLKVGKKAYDRFMGRGCGACHDIKTNPQLVELIKDGSLTKEKFVQVVKNGRNGMPKAGEAIAKVGAKYDYTEDQSIEAVYKYLESMAK